MAGVSVQVVGVPQARAKLAQLSASLRGPVMLRALMAGGLIVQTAAKLKSPGPRTGTLRRSIYLRPVGAGAGGAAVEIGTNLVYAAIHEFGGTIVPVRAQFLHFFVDGQEVFAKQVTIPARPYMRPAFDENRAAVEAAVAAVIRAAIAGVAGA